METILFWFAVTAVQLILAVQLSNLTQATVLRVARPSRP